MKKIIQKLRRVRHNDSFETGNVMYEIAMLLLVTAMPHSLTLKLENQR